MFVVKPENPNSKVRFHHCYSLEVSEKVKDYIENKYEKCTIKEFQNNLPYLTFPGLRFIFPFETICLKNVECKLDELDLSLCAIRNLKDFSKGFGRITCHHHYNVCLSEKEHQEILIYISENKTFLEEKEKEFDQIFESLLKGIKNGKTNNSNGQ